MSTVAEHLPLPAGTRFSAPVRRSRVDVWAAPDPARLVRDPWAAPVGLPVARTLMSPWAPPTASTRITWMPSPAVLLAPPSADGMVSAPDVEFATERALATLRAFAEAPRGSARQIREVGAIRPGDDAAPPPAEPSLEAMRSEATSTLDSSPVVDASEHPAFAPPQPGTAVDHNPAATRWRVIAVVSGIGAALAAAVTLLASVL